MKADGTMRIMIISEQKSELMAEQKLFLELISKVEIICIDSPKEALELALNEHFDLIITEVKMTQMHGIFLARKILQKYRQTNIIFLADTEDYALDALQMCVSDYVLKPISKERIKTSLENLRYPLICYDKVEGSQLCSQ